MRNRRRRSIATLVVTMTAITVYGLAVIAPSGASTAYPTWDRPPTENDYALLTLANMARSQPSLDGLGHETPAPPLVWNDNLAEAARYHNWDMFTHNCFQHNSCNGQDWSKRVASFYGNGWWALGENIASGGSTALNSHNGWMDSPGHRANILSSSYWEFGGSWVPDMYFVTGTEDFGSRGPVTIPAIPAATVLVPVDNQLPTWQWRLLLNYYDKNGLTPTSVKAFVNGTSTPYTLTRATGTNTNGTWDGYITTPGWAFPASPPMICQRMHYEVERSDGQTFRYPTTGDIGFGYAAGCELRSGGSTPPPTTTTTVSPPPGGAPTVVIAAPLAGAHVSKTVQIRASATDDGVVKTIEVDVDGKRLMSRNGSSLVRGWNVGQASVNAGSHTITVKATDNDGNVGTTSVVVTK